RRHTRCYRDWSSDVCSADLHSIMKSDDTLLGLGAHVQHLAAVVDIVGRRRGQMLDMRSEAEQGVVALHYRMPTRGLLGIRNMLQVGRAAVRDRLCIAVTQAD